MTDSTLSSTPASVLTVVAHPDDAEPWAGGTLARLAQSGAAVAVPEHADATRTSEAVTGAGDTWSGEAAEADRVTQDEWDAVVAGMRDDLRRRHTVLGVAQHHQATAVRSNSRMWEV